MTTNNEKDNLVLKALKNNKYDLEIIDDILRKSNTYTLRAPDEILKASEMVEDGVAYCDVVSHIVKCRG